MNNTVSIVIPTHNRKSDLIATLNRINILDPKPFEIIVVLDGCTDNSRNLIEQEFSHVRIISNDKAQGSIPSRDTAFRSAHGDLIVTLDDDSYPVDPKFISLVMKLAEKYPSVGSFGFKEIRSSGPWLIHPALKSDQKYLISAYPNCAGMIRKNVYLNHAHYPRFFSHAYAEPDFCLQVYSAGMNVLYVPEIEVFHEYSHVARDMRSRHHLNARNELWSVIMRCPFPLIILMVPYRIIRQLIFGFSNGWKWIKIEHRWLKQAFLGLPQVIKNRKPVKIKIYLKWIKLSRSPEVYFD